MRFTKAIFRNWVGIYLGLGVTELELDLSRIKNRICLVVGENGSSKTTILEGLTLFSDIYSSVRDSNDFIITDADGECNGYRELWLEHGNITYISKIHWLKDKTKCFLYRKLDTGVIEDLNPNGNVRSYEEQLEIFLGLTKAHNKLLFLGPGLKDVISMTPSDRKGYISSFTPNIDSYLELHKVTTKYYSKLKNDISVITSEIHRLGDDRNRIETLRNTSRDRFTATTEKLQFFKTVEANTINTINMFSVNGIPIVDMYNQKVASHNQICAQLNYDNIRFKNLCAKYQIQASDNIVSIIQLKRDEYLQLKFQKDSFTTRYREMQESYQNLSVTLNSRKSIYSDYVKNNNPDRFISEEASLNDELNEIQSSLQLITEEIPALQDMNLVLFTKDDATKYMIFMDTVASKMSDIRDQFTEKQILDRYLNGEITTSPEENEHLHLTMKLKEVEVNIQKKRDMLIGYEQSKDLSDLLKSIPASCTNQNCPFIKRAKDYFNVNENENNLRQDIASLTEVRESMITRQTYLTEYLANIMQFFKAIRDITSFIDSYSELIAKFPDHAILSDVKELFKNTPFLLPRARRYSEYSYIHDRFNLIANRLFEIKDQIQQSTTYFETVKTMESEIKRIDEQIVNANTQIQQLYNDNQNITNLVQQHELILTELQLLSECRQRIVTGLKVYDQSRRLLKSMRKRFYCGKVFTDRLQQLRDKIGYTHTEISQYSSDLNTAEYNLRRYDEFIIKRDALSEEFQILDVLRKCWSPTTGIPLIFIEGFMNEFLKDANKYLQEIWNDQKFTIKGFNIDEKNFFILVDRGESGIPSKDASQCSGAERAMLCTVLSLALLKRLPRCRDMFNITKFDEIDGTLDYEKRRKFLGILNDLLDEIGSEQAFLISHSDTFQSDVDVILLKGSDDYKARFLNGKYNIVYQY